MNIRVLVANPFEILRIGLKVGFSGTDIQYFGEVATARETLGFVSANRPDVVLLELDMPDLGGFEFLGKLADSFTPARIVVFSRMEQPSYIAKAAGLGLGDYLFLSASKADILGAIRSAFRGSGPVSGGEMEKVLARMRSKDKKLSETFESLLTPRECQVLQHIVLGLSNKEIAKFLKISNETVKEHVRNILRKTSLSDRTQAAVWALSHGMEV